MGVPVGLIVEVRVGEGVELAVGTVVGEEVKLGEGAVVAITAVVVGLAIPPASSIGCRLQLAAKRINIHPRISVANIFFNMGQLTWVNYQ